VRRRGGSLIKEIVLRTTPSEKRTVHIPLKKKKKGKKEATRRRNKGEERNFKEGEIGIGSDIETPLRY